MALANAIGSGATPDSPEAMAMTVSLVDSQPSMLSELNETSTAAPNTSPSRSGPTIASVVMKASIVAIFGRIMPAPFDMPPITQPSRLTTDCFTTESVVMIAVAQSAPESGDCVLHALDTCRGIRTARVHDDSPLQVTVVKAGTTRQHRCSRRLVLGEYRCGYHWLVCDDQGEVERLRLDAASHACC